MTSLSGDEYPSTQPPVPQDEPTPSRPRPRKTGQKVSRPAITRFLAGGGTVQRPDPSAPKEVIVLSSSSEAEGPTPMDKDDSMYRGKLDKNRVDASASASIIRTRAATRASAAGTSLKSPLEVNAKPLKSDATAASAKPRATSSAAKKKAAKSADILEHEVGVDVEQVVVPSTSKKKSAANKATRFEQTLQPAAESTPLGEEVASRSFKLFSPPITPTPGRSKRSSSDQEASDDSDVYLVRRPKRARMLSTTDSSSKPTVRARPAPQDSQIQEYDDEEDDDMVIVKEEPQDCTFDAEHSHSDSNDELESDEENRDVTPVIENEFVDLSRRADKGKKRAPLSPDLPPSDVRSGRRDASAELEDSASFAQAMGLPEDPDSADGITEEVDPTAYGLVLEELHFYRLNFLPPVCEVTHKSLQDKVLRKYYVNLPPLRRGVLTSWSDSQGDGFVKFSDWAATCPSMKFKSCLNAIEFRSHGRYINPCRFSPLECLVKHVPGAVEKYHLLTLDRRHAVCLAVVRSRDSHLLTPNARTGRKSLSGVEHTQEWERYVAFFGTTFVKDELESQVFQEAIEFSTRPSSSGGSHTSTSSPRTHSSPTIKVRGSSNRSSSTRDVQSLSAADHIPIYDCRSNIVDFNRDLDNLDQFPLWKQEIPSGSFVVVAHTATIYRSGTGGWSLSLNILWAMIIGTPARKVYRVTRATDSD